MIRILCIGLGVMLICHNLFGQINTDKFGKGITFNGADSTYQLNVGFRFQTLFDHQWKEDLSSGDFSDTNAKFFIRRSRLKFGGFVLDPRLELKAELALSNRDNSGGSGSEFSRAANIILDASLSYNFYKNWSILFGQRKLPGNRERVISSGDLQLVDRSRLNSRYTTDRDVGFQLLHHHLIGKKFLIKEVFALTGGEGRNITAGHFDGYGYAAKIELYPFGAFKSKGDYKGGAITREETPKLAIAVTYDNNNNAVRTRGRGGSFITDDSGNYIGKDLNTFFMDMMFKYQGFSIMAEYAHNETGDDIPFVFDESGNNIGTFYTGNAVNVMVGYNLPSNWEFTARYTSNNPDENVANDEKEYTVGISKYVVGHKLKIQTDYSYRNVSGGADLRFFRLQTDVHF